MKLNKIIYTICLLALSVAVTGQDKRTVKTKVADALVLLPAADNAQAARLFTVLTDLGDEGITMITDQVLPNGVAEGIAPRFAVSLLTHYATTSEQKVKIEKVYLAALAKATNTEVKAYFLDNLKLVASNVSVKAVTPYLADKDLYSPAIAVLVVLGTSDARTALVGSTAAVSRERVIKALGELKEVSALPMLTKAATESDEGIRKQALWSLALIGDPTSSSILLQQAKAAGYKSDKAESVTALIEYLHQVSVKGNNTLASSTAKTIIENTPDISQQHLRLAGLEALAKSKPEEATKILIKERNHFDAEYRKEVLNIAASFASTPAALKLWDKEYKKATGDEQKDVLYALAAANRNDGFATAYLVPALYSSNPGVRVVAAQELADTQGKKQAEALTNYLMRCTDAAEIAIAKQIVLQVTDKDNAGLLAQKIPAASPQVKIALLQILSARRAVNSYDVVSGLTTSADTAVRSAAYNALPFVSSGAQTASLLKMLAATEDDQQVKALQSAIGNSVNATSVPLIDAAYEQQKLKLIPVLPYVNEPNAITKVKTAFQTGSDKEKSVAFSALQNWQGSDAVRILLDIRRDDALKQYHAAAFTAAINQIVKSSWPDDEKLLLLRASMDLATNKTERSSVLRAAGSVRTFLSLVFVSGYLDDQEVGAAAGRSAMQLSLPTADAKPGMTGAFVRQTLEHMQAKLTGEDSQYERIDIATYLARLPYGRGYESIFNGKDFSGWQGLVENPIARAKMSKEILAKKQAEANAKISQNWSVKNGMITFQGDGANLVTTRPYGDFEMIVDWKISKNGDSGIYLRGSPQVQIWDIARTDAGAQVGSGGLYNNQKEASKPLVVADNPVGEWNTFRIKMVGDRVTVFLNGILVVDNVVMENYWDRNLPIFSEEAIELQAHGTALAFRNLYVKELGSKPYQLTEEEKSQGFEQMFNGKDLDNWSGNKIDYVVEDNAIAIYPTKEGHGNLTTSKEYSDFIFRFEFQLTPGANNGLGIRAPLDGDAAYLGEEIQILDDTAPVYAKLEQWQYHGSVYGIIAAKRGALKPLGEWNQEEVVVKGDAIKVTLNGTVIVDGDLKKASANGTLDHKDHPGLKSKSGYIQFLGHGSVVRFRSIRMKDLSK